MPLLHGGIPSFRWQPPSPGIHNLLGSVPLASPITLEIYAGPCAASSILRLVYYGTFHRDFPMHCFHVLSLIIWLTLNILPWKQNWLLSGRSLLVAEY
jgi:uncharacterized membrane protein YeiH